MKRWSKLQTALYNIIEPTVGFEIHCVAYPMRSKIGYAHESVPRYWITINKEIVWDFPKVCPKEELDAMYYPYCGDLSVISQTIRDYIDCPKDKLLEFDAEDKHWGLIPVLQACDRRIGKASLGKIKNESDVVKQILHLRDPKQFPNQDQTKPESPTWQDICIIADTPLTQEFAEYVYDEEYGEFVKDELTSCNYHPDDPKCKAYLDAIVREGLDWKVYDPFSLTGVMITLKDGRTIREFAQERLFPTDDTPVFRFHQLDERSPRYYQLIIQIDPVSPKVLSRDENLSDELVEELTEWVKVHSSALLTHWENEIASAELLEQIREFDKNNPCRARNFPEVKRPDGES